MTTTAFLYISFITSQMSCTFPYAEPHKIHLSAANKYVLNTYYVSGTLTNAGITVVNKTNKNLCPDRASILVEDREI